MSDISSLSFKSLIPRPPSEVFQWFLDPCTFERRVPPWLNIKNVVQKESRLYFSCDCTFYKRQWILEHRDRIESKEYRDVQLKGPFKSYRHTHRFTAEKENSCQMEDSIEFESFFPIFRKKIKSNLLRALK